jgi:hypothetical protein
MMEVECRGMALATSLALLRGFVVDQPSPDLGAPALIAIPF